MVSFRGAEDSDDEEARGGRKEEKGGARTGGIEYSRFLVKDRSVDSRGGKRDGILAETFRDLALQC